MNPELRHPELWIPGPTQVRREILAALAEPMIGHRTAQMRGLIHALDPHLRAVFGVAGDGHHVAVHSCTATGLMEMALRGTGPRVLALVNGAFSERFAEIAEAVGKRVVRVSSPLGAPPDLALARERIAAEGPFDAITVCLSETSTGALVTAAEVGAALADRGGAALLVDAVTYLAAAPVDASEHGLDFVLAGTQKALALPPGLGLYCVSDRMLDRARAFPDRGFFLDLVRITETHALALPPMTPTIPLVRALLLQFETIAEGALELELSDEPASELAPLDGWSRRYRRHARMREVTRDRAEALGLEVFGGPARGTSSPSVTCLGLGGRDVPSLIAGLARAGFEVAPGYGELRSSTVRIGHMGDHGVPALRRLLDGLDGALGGSQD